MYAYEQSYVKSRCDSVPIVCIYMCVSGSLQYFEDGIIIGHCALHWSIHSFICSVSQLFFSC